MPLQVFIGASSKDYELAQKVYDFLTGHGIEAFFSRESLPRLGSSDYRKQIDAALDQALHMVVVTSSSENVGSTWLEAEWGFFVNEKRSGHKKGNLITVIAERMTLRDLPPSLRYYEVIPFEQLERVLHYLGGSRHQAEPSQPTGGAAASDAQASGKEREETVERRFQVADLLLPDEPMLGFVEVPAGEFLMGSETKDKTAYDDEAPQHTVELPTFYMARYPVTVGQFSVFAQATSTRLGKSYAEPNHPVVRVSWNEAMEYCRWLESTLKESDAMPDTLKRVVGRGYHLSLPSEAEWEKAARGTDGRIYPWGNTLDPSRANYYETQMNRTSEVGAFPAGASPYGILDMSGNVWEWTRSIYRPYPYVADDGRERPNMSGGEQVLRGGAFNGFANLLRAACRYRHDPIRLCDDAGFRVVSSRIRP